MASSHNVILRRSRKQVEAANRKLVRTNSIMVASCLRGVTEGMQKYSPLDGLIVYVGVQL
jgi:hypothetical protein